MRVALLAALALLAAGCLEQDGEGPATQTPTPTGTTPPASTTPTPTPVTPTPPADGEVPFRTLASGQQSATREEQRLIITDRNGYHAFWTGGAEDPQEAPPEVDFEQETVVAVASGARPNTCWALRVTNATDDGYANTVVTVTLFAPTPDLICGQAITYPWHLVALQGADRQVTFREETREGMPEEPAPEE
ncbi:MAG TPA: protease complex subunit PrcB family protein [Candidatus Thermoplasmatota archaeon]|nr:protease complex subunit PrcB family protein [Candidatus Thermoplasmatota archaeon]